MKRKAFKSLATMLMCLVVMVGCSNNDETTKGENLTPEEAAKEDPQTAAYAPVLKEGRSWRYHFKLITDISLYVRGDTLINGILYKKIYAIDKRLRRDGSPGYTCAMREDGSKLYAVLNGQSEEGVVIDYEAAFQVGSRISLYNNHGQYEDFYEVSKTSEIVTQGFQYKVTRLDDTESQYPFYYVWIQGVGFYTRGIKLTFAKNAAGGDYYYVFDACYDGDVCIYQRTDVNIGAAFGLTE